MAMQSLLISYIIVLAQVISTPISGANWANVTWPYYSHFIIFFPQTLQLY